MSSNGELATRCWMAPRLTPNAMRASERDSASSARAAGSSFCSSVEFPSCAAATAGAVAVATTTNASSNYNSDRAYLTAPPALRPAVFWQAHIDRRRLTGLHIDVRRERLVTRLPHFHAMRTHRQTHQQPPILVGPLPHFAID